MRIINPKTGEPFLTKLASVEMISLGPVMELHVVMGDTSSGDDVVALHFSEDELHQLQRAVSA